MGSRISTTLTPSTPGTVHPTRSGSPPGRGTREPAFQNARYLVNRIDLAYQEELAQRFDEDRAIWDRLLAPAHFAEPFGRLVSDGPAGQISWQPVG